MKNPLIQILMFCLLAASSAQGQVHGPTAARHSAMVAESLRFAASQDPSTPAAMRNCIAAVRDEQFEAAARASFLARYSLTELAAIDEFNMSPVAEQYRKYNRDAFLANHGAAPPHPVQLTVEHVAALKRFEGTDVGARYFADLERPPQNPTDPLNIAVRSFFASCRAGS